MKTNRNPKMKQDFFTNLPQEMLIDILSRLPIRTIMSCKCVCKSCRDLIKTRDFVESHFSKSVPCLALFQGVRRSKPYRITEFVNSGKNHCNTVLNFSFPHQTILHSSASGLLFLINLRSPKNLFICNPVTREYIKLPPPEEVSVIDHLNVFGFGVSKLTGEYKVTRLFYEPNRQLINHRTPTKCEVYSLTTGLWRSVAITGDQLQYAEQMSSAVFSNGNLHWLVGEVRFGRILCFDIETECFSTFSIPRLDVGSMCVWGDCLCLCDNSRYGFVIWLMNKYGDDKSWRKEFVIKIYHPYNLRVDHVKPIKVFKDGDILFVRQVSSKLYCYSSKTKTIREIDAAQSFFMVGTKPVIYTPSFVPLKTFTTENNVISF